VSFERLLKFKYFSIKIKNILDGKYEFDANIFKIPIKIEGNWTLVLKKYSQTTSVRRLNGPGGSLEVKVHVDKSKLKCFNESIKFYKACDILSCSW
jgi:hypothetical protein